VGGKAQGRHLSRSRRRRSRQPRSCACTLTALGMVRCCSACSSLRVVRVQLPARRAEVWCRFVWRLSPETRSGEGEVHTSGLAAKWPGPCPQRYLFDELNCLICGERCEVRALSTNSCTPVQKPKAASGAITTLQFTEWIVAPASALALRVLRHLGAPTCELRS